MYNTAISNNLYEEVEQLDNSTLDAFIAQLQALRLSRKTTDKQKMEANLLKKINKTLPDTQISQFQSLNQKRLDNEINETEMLILEQLISKIEKLHTERIKYLGQLATLKNCNVKDLMKDLSLNPIIYG